MTRYKGVLGEEIPQWIVDIARAVGLTPASLYNHFEGKQAIYEAVLERGILPLLQLMRELPTRDHTAHNFEETIGAIMAQLSSRPHLPMACPVPPANPSN